MDDLMLNPGLSPEEGFLRFPEQPVGSVHPAITRDLPQVVLVPPAMVMIGVEGRLVGCDCFGNKYYENNYYMLARNRWVEYNQTVNWDYDASQVTPEWHGWLHHRTDRLPCVDPAKTFLHCCGWCTCWLMPHEEILSGTDQAYYPYSTTRPKTNAWDGTCVMNRCDCD